MVMEMTNEAPYEHARCFPTFDGDVCVDPEPTAGQMRKFNDREFGDAHRNILSMLAESAMTAHAIRGAVLHSEQTIASLLSMWADAGYVVRRADGRYAIGFVPTRLVWGH